MYLEAVPTLGDDLEPAAASSGGSRRRCVPMEDPMRLLLREFLNRCEAAAPGADEKRDHSLLERLAILGAVEAVAASTLTRVRSEPVAVPASSAVT